MHILFTRFPLESTFGGAERQTMSLARGLREKGHEISFLGSCPALLMAFREEGFDAQQLDIGPPPVTKWGAVSFLWRQVFMKNRLIRIVGARHLSSEALLAGHSSKSNGWTKDDAAPLQRSAIFMLSLTEKLLLTDFALRNGLKVFWVEHDRVGRWLKQNPWLPKLKKLSRHVKTIVVSDLSKEMYTKLGWRPENIVSIPNGIDINNFNTIRPIPYTLKPKTFRLGCIARLSREKGIDVLIKAITPLPNITLNIIGRGQEENVLRELIQKNNLGDRVKITNDVPGEELYKNIDALVLPSRDHDPFGLVVAEAMAAGVPTICTDACGIAQHLHHGESIIVKAGNAESIQNAIREVQKPEKWNALRVDGAKAARERFDLMSMIRAYEELL